MRITNKKISAKEIIRKKYMKRRMKSTRMGFVLVSILIIVIAGIIYGCGKTNSEIVFTTGLSKDEVFKIDGDVCTLSEAMVFLTALQNQYENTYGKEIWDQQFDGLTLEEYIKEKTVSQLAQIKNMNLLAKSMEIQLTADEETLAVQMTREYFSGLKDNEIEYMGTTEEGIKDLYSQLILARKTYEEITKDVDTEVSDDEARSVTIKLINRKTYYEDENGNRTEFTPEEKSAAFQMTNEILEIAKGGEDFEILVQKYNEGTDGEITAVRGELEEELEEVAFAMEDEDISGVIETESGYYIIKCINRFDQGKTDMQKLIIAEDRKSNAFYEVYNAFAKELPSEFNKELWESVTLQSNDGVDTENFFSIYHNNN